MSTPMAAAALLAATLVAGCSSLERTTALPAPCADTAGFTELGCANIANLAAMVADPADLQQGRALTPASGEQAATVIEAYEAAPPPAPEQQSQPRTETTE